MTSWQGNYHMLGENVGNWNTASSDFYGSIYLCNICVASRGPQVESGGPNGGQRGSATFLSGRFYIFFFAFLCKCVNDAPSNAPSLTCVTISYIIFASCNVMSSCDMMMSLMMSSHTHVWQVTWPFGIKGATWNGRWFFLHLRPSTSWTTQSMCR